MKFLLPLLLLLTSCASAPRLDEPVRTEVQMSCLSSNLFAALAGEAYSATQCECAEIKAVAKTGLSRTTQFLDENLEPVKATVERFNEAFKEALTECSK